jgi:hypothetical protein
MTVSLASSIAVAVANKPVRLTFTASAGNFVRVWCTAAPAGSKLRGKLDENNASRIHAFDTDSARSVEYTFDASGAYQFAAAEFIKGAAPYGGGYQNAPNSAPAETSLGETPLTFYVASKLKATLGAGSDVAELVIYVANTVIQSTSLAVQGLATPAVQKPKTDKATTAAENSALLTAIAGLTGSTAAIALGDLGALVTDIIIDFNAHIADASFHDTADDGSNRISSAYRSPSTPDALRQSIAQILKALSAHVRNDSATMPTGTGSSGWHQISGTEVVDWASLPLFASTGTISEHVRGLADAQRCFESHRISSAHLAPDTVHALNPVPTLLTVHALFLAQLAAISPPAPVTDNSAKTLLVHGAGFEEV